MPCGSTGPSVEGMLHFHPYWSIPAHQWKCVSIGGDDENGAPKFCRVVAHFLVSRISSSLQARSLLSCTVLPHPLDDARQDFFGLGQGRALGRSILDKTQVAPWQSSPFLWIAGGEICID